MERNSKKTNINYEYFLHYVKSQDDYKNLKVLDYGCGRGEILQLLLDNEINASGVDIYHQGPSSDVLSSELYKKSKIKIIEANKTLPFEDKEFDLIISNQVFEHVSDMGYAFSELRRVLKDSGKMYHHFPSKEVWREGHIGIPFSHWFSAKSKLRYPYVFFLRAIGLGYNKDKHKSIKEWVNHSLNYLDNYCFYRNNRELKKILSGYLIKNQEIEYIKFRGQNISLVRILLRINIFGGIYKFLFRRLAFKCFELKKGK